MSYPEKNNLNPEEKEEMMAQDEPYLSAQNPEFQASDSEQKSLDEKKLPEEIIQ